MSEHDQKRLGIGVADLHNERLVLTSKIDSLLKPFCERWQLSPEQIQIVYNYAGSWIKVTL